MKWNMFAQNAMPTTALTNFCIPARTAAACFYSMIRILTNIRKFPAKNGRKFLMNAVPPIAGHSKGFSAIMNLWRRFWKKKILFIWATGTAPLSRLPRRCAKIWALILRLSMKDKTPQLLLKTGAWQGLSVI